MKKTNQLLKRLMAAVLAVIMLSGVFVTTMPEEAEAADTTLITDAVINARIKELEDKLVGTYWNTGHKSSSCGAVNGSGHYCSSCRNANIITKKWFKDLFGLTSLTVSQFPITYTKSGSITRSAYSCAGFANFAEWYIFRTKDSESVSTTKIGSYASTKANWTDKAKKGDLIRLESGHSFIYLSNNDKGVYVLDCNWSGSYYCKVQKHYISYNKNNTFTISRANPRATCKHTGGYKTEWNGEKYVATICKKCGATFNFKIETSTSGTFYAHAKTSARSHPYEDAPAVIDYNAKDAVTVLGKTVNAYGNIWYQVSKTVSGKTVKGYILSDRLFSSNPNITADYAISYYNNYSGKNYIPDSDFEVLDSSNVFSRDTAISTVSVDSSNKHNGYKTLKVVNAEAGKNGHDIVMKTTTQGTSTLNWIGNSKTMTLSFWAKCTKDGATFSVRWGYEPVAKCRKVTLTTSWKKYTIRMDKTNICDNYLHLFVNAKGTYWMSEVQLEDGTSATDFVPERGGSYTTKKSTYPGKFSLPAAPTRNGYTFAGWYTKNVGGTKFTSSTASKCGKYALYAHWTKKAGTSDPDVYYTYSVSYVGDDGTSLGTSYIKNLQGTTHTVTPPDFSGYETPAAKTVTWDTSVKTIIFTYSKIKTYTYPKTTVSGTIWKYNGTNVLTYKAVIETRNRTADSIEYRVTWTNSIVKDRYYGYTQKYQVKCGSATTGTLTICGSSTMAKSTVGKVRTATKASSWIKVTGLSASTTSLTMKGYFYSGCSEDNMSFSKTITIPAY